jgi:DNA polymerase IV
MFSKLYKQHMHIRLIGIRFTNLITGNYQINLFEDTQENIKLYQAIDSVKRRFVEGVLLKATGD